MKEKIQEFTFCLLCIICTIFIFKHNSDIATIIIDAVNLFFKRVFVSLFPMFIINDILISANTPFYFYKIFNKIFKMLFKTSGICAYVFFMSLISGTPSNAYILKNLVEAKKITNEEASHYLYFTYFSNPLFLIMMLSLIFEMKTVIKIILIHYISNIIIGFIIRKKAPRINENKLIGNKKENIGNVLIKSINRSITTLLMILGTVVFYMLFSYIIANILNINGLSKVLLQSFLEITNGLNLLKTLNISIKIKEIIAIATISFGGLSINTQIKAILEDTDISYSPFLKGRIMQTIISSILILII